MTRSPEWDAWVEKARAVDITSVVNARGGLGLKKYKAELIGPCPQCGGEDRFAVSTKAKKKVFNCRGCGAKGDVIALTQFLDGSNFEHAVEKLTGEAKPESKPKPKPNGKASGDKLGKIVATYDYDKPDGDKTNKLLFQTVRYDPKAFRQRRPDGNGGWIWNLDGVELVPFHLPQLIEAVASEYQVVIVEGEKDVLTAEQIGLIATTSPMGAGKWRDDYDQYFADADVIIVPDNDADANKGAAHAHNIAEHLQKVAKRVRIVTLPNAKDFTAWAEQGGTREQFDKLVEDAPAVTCSIEDVLEVFDRWLDLDNPNALLAVLGTVAANMLPNFDPVWLGVIAPPSSAKTELLRALSKLAYVVQCATLSPAGLLSGTPKKQRDKDAKGGLLNQIGKFGIIVLKDFSNILSMRPDDRAVLIAALREIFDGAWVRTLGVDGGRQIRWQGKVGLVFASTEVIDMFTGFIGGMGDRFLFARTKPTPKQFDKALDHLMSGDQMRAELADAVSRLFVGRRSDPRPINAQERAEIKALVSLIVRLRGSVERDRNSRELQAVYKAEGAGRVGLSLIALLAGLDTLGVERELAMTVIRTVALDSTPPLRRRAYEFLANLPGLPIKTSQVAQELGLPTNTVRRALEELAAYRLVIRRKEVKQTKDGDEKEGQSDTWTKADEDAP